MRLCLAQVDCLLLQLRRSTIWCTACKWVHAHDALAGRRRLGQRFRMNTPACAAISCSLFRLWCPLGNKTAGKAKWLLQRLASTGLLLRQFPHEPQDGAGRSQILVVPASSLSDHHHQFWGGWVGQLATVGNLWMASPRQTAAATAVPAGPGLCCMNSQFPVHLINRLVEGCEVRTSHEAKLGPGHS